MALSFLSVITLKAVERKTCASWTFNKAMLLNPRKTSAKANSLPSSCEIIESSRSDIYSIMFNTFINLWKHVRAIWGSLKKKTALLNISKVTLVHLWWQTCFRCYMLKERHVVQAYEHTSMIEAIRRLFYCHNGTNKKTKANQQEIVFCHAATLLMWFSPFFFCWAGVFVQWMR